MRQQPEHRRNRKAGISRTPELDSFKIIAFPAPLEEKSLPYRHATFSISVESSPLALHPRLCCERGCAEFYQAA